MSSVQTSGETHPVPAALLRWADLASNSDKSPYSVCGQASSLTPWASALSPGDGVRAPESLLLVVVRAGDPSPPPTAPLSWGLTSVGLSEPLK